MSRRPRAHDGWRRPLAFLLFAFATRAAPARSTEAPRLSRLAVSIEGDACSSALVDEVLYLAKIELRNQLVDSPAGADCRVTISCAASRVAVVARADGKARAHETDLSDVAESLRPRLAA